MNIVFAGTPHFTLPCLNALASSKHQLTAIYTQPDRPAGRGHKLQPSPVKVWAETHGIPVYQPLNFKTQESINTLAALAPDIMIVIAYGLILPRTILTIPRYGCVNVHASLLPLWRGASPIQQAILHHNASSGITLMQMDEGMDTGAILATASCSIDSQDTAGTLHDKLAELSPPLLLTLLDDLASGHVTPKAQDSQLASYAPKIKKEDAAIRWQQPASAIDCQVRAFNPWPIAYTHANDVTVRVHKARILNQASDEKPGTIMNIDKEGIQVATGQHTLLIEQLQFAGGKAMSVSDWLNAKHRQLHVHQVLK